MVEEMDRQPARRLRCLKAAFPSCAARVASTGSAGLHIFRIVPVRMWFPRSSGYRLPFAFPACVGMTREYPKFFLVLSNLWTKLRHLKGQGVLSAGGRPMELWSVTQLFHRKEQKQRSLNLDYNVLTVLYQCTESLQGLTNTN